jgi:hypothetical protein
VSLAGYPRPEGNQLSTTRQRPCPDCGQVGPPAEQIAQMPDFDVAIHDCDSGRWQLLTMTFPNREARRAAQRAARRKGES